MHEDTFDMYNTFIPYSQTESLERRKDARKNVNATQLLVANCRTMDGDFQAPIENVSSGGVFINTNQRLFVGRKIQDVF